MTMDLPCPSSKIPPPPALVGHAQPLAAQETLSPRVLTPPCTLLMRHRLMWGSLLRPPTASAPEYSLVTFHYAIRLLLNHCLILLRLRSIIHPAKSCIMSPTSQNGEVIVRPSLNMIRDGSKRWVHTAVGYFLGKKPYFYHIDEFARTNWPGLKDVTATASGFFFFRFQSEVAMTEIIEGGPWLFQGQPIVLQRWQPGMALRKLKHTEVPVWIKLKHLPIEYWTEEGLSVVASGIGKPLYPDAITKACTRLDFARVCVMLNIASKLPKHIVILAPTAEGGEIPCKVDVEYEWVPKKCVTCMSLGHSASSCPTLQSSSKKPVNVFVAKVRPVDTAARQETNASSMGADQEHSSLRWIALTFQM
ncbi:UNVERIFIED_CONTAM: hypothetical protein Slati_2208600 [Sesamum latifolium]|uniref:DUF4283 domain-containing protein n=1 Tax=Sesamum latifolium TaxID=2727402 RepID=A0AAW2WS29_9LAMI